MPERAKLSAVAAVLIGVFVLGLAVPVTLWRVQRPFLGVSYAVEDPGAPAVVTDVIPNGTAAALGVQRGDELVSIGSVEIPRSVESRALWGSHFELLNRYQPGDAVPWAVSRNGEELSLVGPLLGRPPALLTSQILVFGAFWALAYFLLWARWKVKAVRHLLWAVLAVTAGQYLRYGWGMPLDSAAGAVSAQASALARFLGPALVVHFGLVFPVEWQPSRARRGILAVAYGLPFALFIAEEAEVLRGTFDSAVPYPYPFAILERWHYYDVRFWVFVGSFVACGALLLRTYLRVGERTVRQRVKWVVWGIVLAATLDALAMGAAYYLTGGYPMVRAEPFRNLLYLLPAAGIGISVFRHDLFDVDRVIRRTVASLGGMGLVFLLFVTVETAASELLEDMIPSAGLVASIAAGVVAAGIFNPLRLWIDRRMRALYDGGSPPATEPVEWTGPEPRGTDEGDEK